LGVRVIDFVIEQAGGIWMTIIVSNGISRQEKMSRQLK
jgi:hypothetical protein